MNRILIAVLLMMLTVGTGYSNWNMSSHGSCSPYSIAADSSGNRIFIGLRDGGFWLTEDGGTSWTQINERISESQLVFPYPRYCVAMDPAADTLIVYASALQPRVSGAEYHSLDGGLTWSHFNVDPFWPPGLFHIRGMGDPTYILRHPPGRAYLSRQAGFCISYGGDTWNVVDISAYERGIEGGFFEQARPDTIYLYGSWGPDAPPYKGGVIASYDGGWNWQRLTIMEDLTEETGFVRDLVRIEENTLIALTSWSWDTQHPPLLRSDDDGENWYWVESEGLPQSTIGTRSLCNIPERPGRLLLGAAARVGVWESDDYGQNWHRLQRGLPVNGGGAAEIYRNEYSGHLYVGFFGQGLFRSTDYGDSWEEVSGPPISVQTAEWRGLIVDENGVAQSGYNGELFYATGTSTIFQEYTPPLSGEAHYQMFPVNFIEDELLFTQVRHPFWPQSGNGYPLFYQSMVEYDVVNQTTTSTSESAFEAAPSFVFVIQDGDSTIFVGSDQIDVGVSISWDEGENWEFRDAGFESTFTLLQVFDQDLYAYEIDGQGYADVARSTDLGESWEMLNLPVEANWSDVISEMLFLDDTLYVAADDQVLAYLPDDTWELRGLLSSAEDVGSIWMHWTMVSNDDETFIISGTDSRHQLLTSTDYGWCWQ
ncbi:MAG TPA: hypothetical protein ENH10_10585, partial [Bacteroidetes bacterium]|nr:hypothetical protein [Bacteroidota bacterium]HEX05579.1 hypothetical protein [Bacteroidota bacterium]